MFKYLKALEFKLKICHTVFFWLDKELLEFFKEDIIDLS